MKVLVSDTSVLIDLHRGGLIPVVFGLPFTFVVPDLLYENEIKGHEDLDFLGQGIEVMDLDAAGVSLAQRYAALTVGLSVTDGFALALAKTNGFELLTGDNILRMLAVSENVDCHGVLWLVDRMEHEKTVSVVVLHDALVKMQSHARCRLPKSEVTRRIKHFAELLR